MSDSKVVPECFVPTSTDPDDLYDSATLALKTASGCALALMQYKSLPPESIESLAYLITDLIAATRSHLNQLMDARR